MTSISAKEGSHFYAAVSTIKSMHRIATTSCHIGYSLSDTKKTFTMPEHITTL